jgi:hypothetical protein
MHIVGELKMDYRGYRRLVLSATPLFARILPMLLVPVLLLLLAALVVAGAAWSVQTLGLILVCVFAAVSIDFGVWIGWRRTVKAGDEPFRYALSDRAIEVHSPVAHVTTRWDTVRRARTLRHAWVLRLANKAALPIPRAAFTAEDAARIDAFVAGVGASR